MINTVGVTLRFGKRVLFEDVNIKFTKGNCYGLIGANGAGKSTFLKILSGEIEPSKGEVSIEKGARLSVLKQDHFAYEDYTIIDTVIMGNEELYKIMKQKEEIYAKPDFSEEDGIKVAKLEERFLDLDGWNAEADAATLLNNLGIPAVDHYKLMKEIEAKDKVKVLLAQSLFGNPDILLLDEPTNDLDLKSIEWLQEFIARFSANASKSKQATSRKKSLEKIELEEIKASNRKYPYIDFKPDREPGKEILTVKNISKTINGVKVLDNISFAVKADNKIAVLADNEMATTTLFQIIAGELEPDQGEIIWGQTITKDYFPKDNSYLFQRDEALVDWLRKYSKDPDETYVRGFLGRMLFSGDEALKNVKILSGGEKVRCVLSKLMLSGANFLIFDEPTNHLDMESITALNEGMKKFKGNMIFTSHDHQLMQTVADRIIDIRKDKVIDRECTYNEYLGI